MADVDAASVAPPRRVTLVTGANRGLGLAIAERLAAAGNRVVGTYRSEHPEVEGVSWVRCDVGDPASVDAAFAEVESTLGPVEVLVSNAGITKDGLVLRMSDDDFTSVVDANLAGAFRVAKRAAQGMVRARWGRIVFVSSISGRVGQAGQVNYAASKAGLVGLAKSLARELASRNICVNVVEPGPLPTEMTAALSDDQRAQLVAHVPLGRMGELHEVAAAVEFLAGEHASYITGAALGVDGGLGM
jgi:NAD(P)-dependent dehydrogenase (short-subunit alcohol dehydrogenase family)